MNRSSISSAGVLITAVVALGVGLLSPSAAEAHTRTQETTNLDSRITADPDFSLASLVAAATGVCLCVTLVRRI